MLNFLSDKLKDTANLLKVLLKDTIYNDKERRKEVLLSLLKTSIEQDVVTAGHAASG